MNGRPERAETNERMLYAATPRTRTRASETIPNTSFSANTPGSSVATTARHATILLTLSLLFIANLTIAPTTTTAQPNFDIGNSEVGFLNNDNNTIILGFNVGGLIFDDQLKSTHRFAFVDGGSMNQGAGWGYEAPWSTVSGGGDIDAVKDTLGCSEYDISFGGVTFRLNMIDAQWGAGTQSTIYRLLFEYAGSDVLIWVRSPGGTWHNSALTVTNGGTYTYWGLIQWAFPGVGYLRERTTHNNERFHVTGTDDQLPLPSTFVTNAKLDVNLDVHVDVFVPSGRSLLIEGFDEGATGNAGTTLLFDDATGLTVRGSLRTIETLYRNEWIYFTSAAGDPAPGDWDGIRGDAPAWMYLNRCGIHYADIGLDVADCYTVEGYHVQVAHSANDGVRISGSSGLFDDLYSNHNAFDNLNVTSSELYFYNSVFVSSQYGNGVSVGDTSVVLLSQCMSYYNRMCGVTAYTEVNLTIDSCEIFDNAAIDGEYWMGVYAWFASEPVVIRRSRIHGQDEGIRATNSTIFGYERHSEPVTWDNPDSLGRNCVYRNDDNLYGYESVYEFGRTYPDGRTPHYQGGENSIFAPGTLQGDFELSTVYLERNWWDGNTIFNVLNSMVTTYDALTADAAGCPVESLMSSPSAPITACWNPQAAALYASWDALAADSLRTLLYGQLSSLSALDAITGFERIWRLSDRSVAEAWFVQVIANATRPEVLRAAYRYIAAARMRVRDYTSATQALLAMAGYAPFGGTGYVSAQAMAAVAMHLGGSTASARASIDTLMQAYPDVPEVRMADWIVGRNGTPKRGASRRTPRPASDLELGAPWPNPASTTTMLAFTLGAAADVEVAVYDVLGREVRRLATGMHPAGTTHLVFNGADLPGGLYLVRMTANGMTRTRTVRILR